MHIKKFAALALALAAVAPGIVRADDDPKGYACTFATGTAWTFEDGAFKSKASEPIAFAIADIDLDRQTALLVTEGSPKPASLKIVRAINANHFLEVVNEGFLNLTTVYDKDATSGTYPAVHSRHFGVLGQPVVAQYAGSCTAK
ncbi:MAG TPA: hypothetical protein VIG38_02745 [Hyphomicrobium sp.]|jgi:hypothetical protein